MVKTRRKRRKIKMVVLRKTKSRHCKQCGKVIEDILPKDEKKTNINKKNLEKGKKVKED